MPSPSLGPGMKAAAESPLADAANRTGKRQLFGNSPCRIFYQTAKNPFINYFSILISL